MKKLAARRRQNIAALLGLSVLFLAVDASASAALHRTTMASGWLLLALIVGLALYNVRKKFPFLPIGNSATWLQTLCSMVMDPRRRTLRVSDGPSCDQPFQEYKLP